MAEKSTKDDDKFFKFYEDYFEDEIKTAYEKIVQAFVDAEILPAGTTLENVVAECKKIDQDQQGKEIKEKNIGLMGYFRKKLEDKGFAKNLCKLLEINEPDKIDGKELSDIWKAMGKRALDRIEIPDNAEDLNEEQLADRKATIEAKAFLGELATGPYFPRLTCFTASHLMGEGRIMQIGCSQGKTSIVAMTTYEQLKQEKKVFSTSSAPDLVPENYNEAREFYETMGIAEEFCAITQDPKDNVEHIVLFHGGKKYEVRADGKIKVEQENKEMEEETITPELCDSLGLALDGKGGYAFQASIQKMMSEKGIIMGDTITLGKYQKLMPKRNNDGVIEDSFLIVDEADAELYDAQVQEVLGKKYKENEAETRWGKRLYAKQLVESLQDGSTLEQLAKEKEIDLDFLVDAYEAKTYIKNGANWDIRKGQVFVLNPNTSVMIPASQGLQEAILAINGEERNTEVNPEKEVLEEFTVPEVFSNFEVASLMSGTMQDKGLSKFASDETKKNYNESRKHYLRTCGSGIEISASHGVIDYPLVTPKTRKERGDAVVGESGIDRDDDGNISTKTGFELPKGTNWSEYIKNNGEKLEKQWRESVKAEAEFRAKNGQPVMVSVYGDRVPLDNVEVYTDKDKIDEEHKVGDNKYLSTTEDSAGKDIGEIAQFDDYYGRGYTFKFYKKDKDGKLEKDGKGKIVKQENGGHVLITALPKNSRNLEQFLFRVARGGDKGSSSMIISPTDPVLIKHLENMQAIYEKDPSATNPDKYFEGIMNGTISLEQLVVDIYPEEAKKIFAKKQAEQETIKYYKNAKNSTKNELMQLKIPDEIIQNVLQEYEKQKLKIMKLHRVTEMPEKGEALNKYLDTILCNTAKELANKKIIIDPVVLRAILPVDVTNETLEELFPGKENKELSQSLINLNNEIKKAETRETSSEGRTADQILDATETDLEYNSETSAEALAKIRKQRRENVKTGENQVEDVRGD